MLTDTAIIKHDVVVCQYGIVVFCCFIWDVRYVFSRDNYILGQQRKKREIEVEISMRIMYDT